MSLELIFGDRMAPTPRRVPFPWKAEASVSTRTRAPRRSADWRKLGGSGPGSGFQGSVEGSGHRISEPEVRVSQGDPAPSLPPPPLLPCDVYSPVLLEAPGAPRRGVRSGGRRSPDPSSYRIVEEIRLVQIPQVQEAGSGKQPVGREGLQDGVHHGRLRRPPNGWASPHSRAAARPAQSSGPSVGKRAGWEGGAGRSRAKPRGRGGQRRRGPGSGARGARRPLGQRRRAGCAQGPRAHRGHLADSSSAGSCRGTAGFHGEPGSGAEGLRSPPDRVGAGGGGAERSPLRLGGCRALRSLCVSLCTASVTFPLCEAGNPGLVSPAGRGATPPTSIFTIISY